MGCKRSTDLERLGTATVSLLLEQAIFLQHTVNYSGLRRQAESDRYLYGESRNHHRSTGSLLWNYSTWKSIAIYPTVNSIPNCHVFEWLRLYILSRTLGKEIHCLHKMQTKTTTAQPDVIGSDRQCMSSTWASRCKCEGVVITLAFPYY